MNLTLTHAYGFDVVLAIDPASYEIAEDARGRAYVFQMDGEARAASDDADDEVDAPARGFY